MCSDEVHTVYLESFFWLHINIAKTGEISVIFSGSSLITLKK